jgi:gluconate 2-dehydrogenase gamma chain
MADNSQKPASDRRTFLKIGAGVVAGAAVASVVEIPYYSSVIGSNNSSSSSTVSSLSNELAATQSSLADTTAQLSSATSTIATLNSQLSSTQTALNNATSSLSSANAQNSSLSGQLTSTQSSLNSATSQISSLQNAVTTANNQVTSLQSAVTSAQSQASSLQTQVSTLSSNADAFIALGVQEAAVVNAAANTIIPTDSNGPGASTAGVIYFIDRQLNGDYGTNGRMYNKGPFVAPNQTGPITVGGVTYSAGTPPTTWVAGQSYFYPMSLRNFWHYGIAALETYANSAYGGNFESLSAANQLACLQDLFNNKPTTFNSIIPSDFANELFFMTWAGFLMDPMYGGNRGMVGWVLTASPGLNSGNFYGEGLTPKLRMVSSTPTVLKPASMAQFQQSLGVSGIQGGST